MNLGVRVGLSRLFFPLIKVLKIVCAQLGAVKHLGGSLSSSEGSLQQLVIVVQG